MYFIDHWLDVLVFRLVDLLYEMLWFQHVHEERLVFIIVQKGVGVPTLKKSMLKQVGSAGLPVNRNPGGNNKNIDTEHCGSCIQAHFRYNHLKEQWEDL